MATNPVVRNFFFPHGEWGKRGKEDQRESETPRILDKLKNKWWYDKGECGAKDSGSKVSCCRFYVKKKKGALGPVGSFCQELVCQHSCQRARRCG